MQAFSTTDELRTYLLAEYNRPFSGWDLSYLEGRRVTIKPADGWDYTAAVGAAIATAHSMLDMDTGGGEYLASLPALPAYTCATEGYPANVPIARERLKGRGVEVYDVPDAARLPFRDGQFDLITNRHGAYVPGEVWRVLRSGGQFITQQVGGSANRRLHELLGATADAYRTGSKTGAEWALRPAVRDLQAASFRILEQREVFPITRYFDVGAIVYYLKAVSWEIADFSVDRYLDKLVDLHRRIQAEGYVDIPFHLFFIRAEKPGGASG